MTIYVYNEVVAMAGHAHILLADQTLNLNFKRV